MENKSPFIDDIDFFKSAELTEEGLLIKHKYIKKVGEGANAKYYYKEGIGAKKQIQKEGEKDTQRQYEETHDKEKRKEQIGKKEDFNEVQKYGLQSFSHLLKEFPNKKEVKIQSFISEIGKQYDSDNPRINKVITELFKIKDRTIKNPYYDKKRI